MKENSIQIGSLIISDTNTLTDLNFNRSVILLADETKNGNLGFIINKKMNIKLNDIIETKSNFKNILWWSCRTRKFVFYTQCSTINKK